MSDIRELKPYLTMPIAECGERLVRIPTDAIALSEPHPYAAVGAPYGLSSPWMLRARVLAALLRSQQRLSARQPGWRIKLFDAYRPIEVQAYMFDRALAKQAGEQGLSVTSLTAEQRRSLTMVVSKFWAFPSSDPTTPPPHSTGAALDCSLVDQSDEPVEMGGNVDDIAEHSAPHYYARSLAEKERRYDHHRALLNEVMTAEGFNRHLNEWWHFSLGDQYWAWVEQQKPHHPNVQAVFGLAPMPT